MGENEKKYDFKAIKKIKFERPLLLRKLLSFIQFGNMANDRHRILPRCV